MDLQASSPAPDSREHLCNLLSYAEEILKIGERVISDLSEHAVVAVYEHEVLGLDSVSVRDDTGDWLSIDRLRPIDPPEPDPQFLQWRQKQAEAFDRPRLKDRLSLPLTPEQASDLEEAGLLLPEDVSAPVECQQGGTDLIEVCLRISNLTEFAAEFEQWVEGPWCRWAEQEAPRRKAIAIYNKLFEVQQRMQAMGDDTAVEVIFGVGMARWLYERKRISVPLIEFPVDLFLEAESGTIVVRDRGKRPQLVLQAFEALEIEGAPKLRQDAERQLMRLCQDPDIDLSPLNQAALEPLLRMCHARLSASAVFAPDDEDQRTGRSLAPAGETLRITDTWVLYVRRRATNIRCDDIRHLHDQIRGAVDETPLPPPALQIVTPPKDAPIATDHIDLQDTGLHIPETSILPETSGRSNLGAGNRVGQDTAQNDFFILPFNDEQIQIIRRLEDESVSTVVVQGPPGTGKTHTIANIVSHYMATGRRVLVSARSPEALSAIQHKLPTSIQDLVISVIHSDREGARRLETAVGILAGEVKRIDVRSYNQHRLDLEAQLAQTRRDLDRIEHKLWDFAQQNLSPVAYQGETLGAMDLTARVEADRGVHSWFPDALEPGSPFEPKFTPHDVNQIKEIRLRLGLDICYSAAQIPDPARLPDLATMLNARCALLRERTNQARLATGDLPLVSLESAAGSAEILELYHWLKAMEAWLDGLKDPDLWLRDLYRLLVGAKSAHDAVRSGLHTMCQEWSDLYDEAASFKLRAIQTSSLPPEAAEFDRAVQALAQGRKPFGRLSFGKLHLKACIEAVRIDGGPPSGPDQWASIAVFRNWQSRAFSFAARWSGVARAFDWPTLPTEWSQLETDLLRTGEHLQCAFQLHAGAQQSRTCLSQVFPVGLDPDLVAFNFEVKPPVEALTIHLDKDAYAAACDVQQRLSAFAGEETLPFHQALRVTSEALNAIGPSDRELASQWQAIVAEARRLNGVLADRRRLEELATKVKSSGAPNWAEALLSCPATTEDPLTPPHWQSTWEWARADGFLRSISDRSKPAALEQQRKELEDKERALLAEIVRLRTFIGLKQGITQRVASALTKFAVKVRQLGAGTGKSAEHHRRAIREAALEAAAAVPCWVLPEWRVAEQLPGELAIFDLVVIDEASQSDITALPIILRGKKLLVVGDDKQVSPSAVGIELRTVAKLRETYLRGMHIANFLEPTTSLYELAAMTNPGTVIMLQEHFRCVEPIIRFSSRFYPKSLVPLRIPTAMERLEPPLIDIYVPHGRKDLDRNEAEAIAITDEIEKLIDDPKFTGRSIGVISLIGDKQAKFVWDALSKRIGTDAIAKHRILCGNASTFQGQERDIIFLSMVACPATARAQTARLMEQRFNVALSRARDRMYLVRSVAASQLAPNDLKLAVIEHFRNPMEGATLAQPEEILTHVESGFERDFGACLLKHGYRLRPQVQIGPYRIDFVIEGEGDRRLAIELDGERFHGPDRWAEDCRRQRALERMGWTFWRCWGSHWLSSRQECLDDLFATLERHGITPVGADTSPQVWTEHRVVSSDPGLSAFPVLGDGDDDTTGQLPFPLPSAPGDREQNPLVEVGDTVIVRLADTDRVRRFRLTTDANKPDSGLVNIGQPIAQALLGNAVDEEIDLTIDGQEKRVIIEKITKAA